jgi:hypothetical protein
MPRKKTVQPKPLERFHLADGTEVEIVDETCWPIGRGQLAARDFEVQRMEPIIENIITIYLGPNGPTKVKEILSSASRFADHLSLTGIFGEDGGDDTNARKYWYERIKFRAYTYINAKENTGP